MERKDSAVSLIIIARLIPSGRYVLIRQYRPAVEGYVYGFPAGLSETEDVARDALRELREETGYHGRITEMSPPLKSNSGLMNNNVVIAKVDIDEAEKRNMDPRQELEISEEIEVLLLPGEEVRQFLLMEKEKGYEIGVGLWQYFDR